WAPRAATRAARSWWRARPSRWRGTRAATPGATSATRSSAADRELMVAGVCLQPRPSGRYLREVRRGASRLVGTLDRASTPGYDRMHVVDGLRPRPRDGRARDRDRGQARARG